MKVSMNGLRTNLTNDVNDLRDILNDEYNKIPCETLCNLKLVFDCVACDVNILNCTYDEDNESFSDLSNNYKIETFEQKSKHLTQTMCKSVTEDHPDISLVNFRPLVDKGL